ncbi:MAG: GNAT family N-acetyltransferase [Planctomycetes bacterium]|nr:GNAT family N-acetyltransferase [Planctomycetota bacterium]
MSGASSRLRILEWDSTFFGFRIGTLVGAPRSADDVAQVVAEARAQDVACLYALCSADDQVAIESLAGGGARFVDVRMTFERVLTSADAAASAGQIRPATADDVPELRALAATSHGSSRFYADRRFPRERCDALFAAWIERSCTGWADVVLVADEGSGVRGYTTGHARAGDLAEIGLVAVDARAQGRGLGHRLVTGTLAVLAARGARKATVVTQGRNVGAQRLYESIGFRTQSVQTWHHLWLDEVRT